MEYIRASRETPRAVVISDPRPVANVAGLWTSAAHAAVIGIFLLLFGAFLYFGRALLLPILAAAVIALTLAPSIRAAKRRGAKVIAGVRARYRDEAAALGADFVLTLGEDDWSGGDIDSVGDTVGHSF